MEDQYIVRFRKTDFDRIVHLIEKEEVNRVKSREKSRAKPGLMYTRGPLKRKIEFELLEIIKSKLTSEYSDTYSLKHLSPRSQALASQYSGHSYHYGTGPYSHPQGYPPPYPSSNYPPQYQPFIHQLRSPPPSSQQLSPPPSQYSSYYNPQQSVYGPQPYFSEQEATSHVTIPPQQSKSRTRTSSVQTEQLSLPLLPQVSLTPPPLTRTQEQPSQLSPHPESRQPQDIARTTATARAIFPQTPLVLECMRPKGEHRVETDVLALKAGVDGIAFPSEEAIQHAKTHGYDVAFSSFCCAQIYKDLTAK